MSECPKIFRNMWLPTASGAFLSGNRLPIALCSPGRQPAQRLIGLLRDWV
jgi:hypothetical protein